MTNLEIAKLLRRVAAAYTVLGENRFKVIAYDNAATSVEHATSELKDLWDEQALDSVPGLGAAIKTHLDELFKTGHSKHFDKILSRVNPAVFPLLDVPGLGPKKAVRLVTALGLKSLAELEKAARTHKIAGVEGFGAKSETGILENIARFRKGAVKQRRMLLSLADAVANEVISYLNVKVDKLGSLRRGVSTIGDIDLAVATNKPKEIIQKFIDYPRKTGLVEKGPTGASILLTSGRQVDLRVAKPEEYGAMLSYFTGSKYHNIRLRELAIRKHLTLNEYGVGKKKFRTEKELYNFLGLDYIPPELREDSGEIEAAMHHRLPRLLELKDIKGDFQVHSNFDREVSHDAGVDSIERIRDEAWKLNYEYVAITNHNPKARSPVWARIKAQKSHIEQLNSKIQGVRVLNMLEVDISPDGSLPVSDEALKYLDGCLVAIHSNFNSTKDAMTKRVLAGFSHPAARILAHPTGRLLGQREGYELDWEQVFQFCLDHNKALEINAYPNRLDLPDNLVHQAVSRRVLISLGTDAHRVEDMKMMTYGVSVARRGWAEAKNVINTWSYDKMISWLRERR